MGENNCYGMCRRLWEQSERDIIITCSNIILNSSFSNAIINYANPVGMKYCKNKTLGQWRHDARRCGLSCFNLSGYVFSVPLSYFVSVNSPEKQQFNQILPDTLTTSSVRVTCALKNLQHCT